MAAANSLRAWGEGEARSKGGPLLKPLLAPIPRSSGTNSLPLPGHGRARGSISTPQGPCPFLVTEDCQQGQVSPASAPSSPHLEHTLCPENTCVPGSGLCVCLSTSETVAAPEPVAAHTCLRVALSPSHFARPRLPPSHQWKVHSSSQS